MPPSVVRQASSAITRASSRAPKRSSRSVVRPRCLGGEEVDDDVAALRLAPRHEQGDRSTGGAAGQLEVADDGPADQVAADQADAGHQRHRGEQHARQDWRRAWRAIEASARCESCGRRGSGVSIAEAVRGACCRSAPMARIRRVSTGCRAFSSFKPESSSSSMIWQLRRLFGRRSRRRHVEHRVLVEEGGAGARPRPRRHRRGRWRRSSAPALGLDAVDAGVDRAAHQALPDLAPAGRDPAVGLDQVDWIVSHPRARSG